MALLFPNPDGKTVIGNAMVASHGMMAYVWLVLIVLLIVALWRIYDAAGAAAPVHRTMEPAMVWLLLIPVFNVFWNFKAFPAVSDSLAATLRDKGLDPGDCGRTFGIVWAVLVMIIWILHVIAWITDITVSVVGGPKAWAMMDVLGIMILLAWILLLACIVVYIVKVQAAKSRIMEAGNAPAPPA